MKAKSLVLLFVVAGDVAAAGLSEHTQDICTKASDAAITTMIGRQAGMSKDKLVSVSGTNGVVLEQIDRAYAVPKSEDDIEVRRAIGQFGVKEYARCVDVMLSTDAIINR